jgi:uracil-DNA glycosylase family 4
LTIDAATFDDLCGMASACRRCPAMEGRRRVLSTANGRPGAQVMFVAEAPGRRGADRTGVPLSGDRSGRRFEALLDLVGWNRTDVFVTNAVLCNPRSPDGRNRSPTAAEIAACRDFLRAQIDLIMPSVVASLGAVALRALDDVIPHGLRLAEAVGLPWRWGDRWLFPLYHPGERARLRRSDDDQRRDMRALAGFLDLLVQRTSPSWPSTDRPAIASMAEVPDAGEEHRQAGAIGGIDARLVTDRAARLDDGRHA